ncbi:MAG: hypothetical protein H7Y09_05285 [Chitinophagaceae bacterium]|nr:hypothetical protein [Anaerolineae bacterium]
MKRTQLGLLLIGIGFILAIAGGLYLAASDFETNAFALRGFIAFVVIVPLIGAGIYFYIRPQQEEAEPESFVRQQRELLDNLRSRGQMTFSDAAQQLAVSEEAVIEMVNQLITLEIFNGEVDWQKGILYAGQSQFDEIPND